MGGIEVYLLFEVKNTNPFPITGKGFGPGNRSPYSRSRGLGLQILKNQRNNATATKTVKNAMIGRGLLCIKLQKKIEKKKNK